MEILRRLKSRILESRVRRSLLRQLGLFSLCLLVAVSCGTPKTAAPSSPAANNGRVTMGTTLKAETVDPADAYELFSGILLSNLGDRLYTYKTGTTELEPQLASALPEISANGLTYKIPLRSGVTFHDGSPFNAEAMAFSIQRFMQNGGRPAFLLSDKIAQVTATGDAELTITLKAPFAAFPALLAFSGVTPVPPKAYEIGAGKFKPKAFIGTGPYKLANFGTDSIRLDAYEGYWGEKPANKGMDIQLVTSPANLYNSFRTGGLDIAYQTLDPDQIRTLEQGANQGGWQVIQAGTNTVNYMVLNAKSEPLNNVKVRQAIAALIDRNLLNQRVFQGQAEPLYSLLPTTFPLYKPVFKDNYGDGQYDKAQQLLTEAGFSPAKPLAFELWYSSSSTTRGLVASTLKAAIDEKLPGLVNLTLNSVESGTLFDNLDKGTYQATLLDWYPDYYDAETFIDPFLSCDKGSVEQGCESGQSQAGGSFYYSDRANTLLKKQRSETDSKVRDADFIQLQDLLGEDVPYIPIWQNRDYVFAQGTVQGVAIQPSQQFLFGQIKK
ncbi:MAG: peptide ABC transporter substrate-binding protein [Oscillatoriophycideae cyanobacterium NC_groundwater_1537_Pr4_S-0.65um_50_18]|nr:peptide ABC transporter substrate-binding protein [Oscillatoriophycideae cyanobacterium NC_groundwater_1537_Pr4_S-0.65um_50_18]